MKKMVKFNLATIKMCDIKYQKLTARRESSGHQLIRGQYQMQKAVTQVNQKGLGERFFSILLSPKLCSVGGFAQHRLTAAIGVEFCSCLFV